MSIFKESKIAWIAAFLLYLLLYPYFAWRVTGLYNWLVTLPLFFIFLTHRSFQNKSIVSFAIFFLISLLGGFCFSNYIDSAIFTTFCSVIFLSDKNFLWLIYKKYRLIFIVLITLSMLVSLLVSLGVNMPYQIITSSARSGTETNFLAYPFYVRADKLFWDYKYLRFNGLFDEPGVVGTQALLFLTIERFNLKKVGNICILIAGLYSLSLFFYLATFVYLSIYIFLNTSVSFTKKFFFSTLIVLFLIFTFTNDATYQLIWERLVWDSTSSTIVGDNRADDDLKKYVNNIFGTSDFYFGVHNSSIIARFSESASIYNAILKYGFITVSLFVSFFVVLSYLNIRKRIYFLIFLFVFIATLYTRPTMFSFERLFMFYMAILSFKKIESFSN